MMSLKKSKWWLFLVTTSGTSLIFLDTTVMPVALPTIQKQFHFHPVTLVWVINAYLLSLSALLLIGGRLVDLFGKRFLFVSGLIFFGVGSLIAAMSYQGWILLLARVIQGAGAALNLPATSALLISTFPEGERAKAIGINTGISSIFLILGPVVGGFLTQYVSWRSIFFINIPIVLFGITMAMMLLNKGERKKESFHIAGALAMLIGVVCLVVGLMEANKWGWASIFTLSFLLACPFFFGLFVWISLRTAHPIIDFHFFRNRLFTAANISTFISQSVVMVTVLWAIYFQQHLNYTAAQTGILIFLAAFPVFLMAPVGGYIADRYGARLPLLFGYAILTFALVWLLFTAASDDILVLSPGLLGFGFSLPLIMSPTVALALSQVQAQKLGAASGITCETRQLASTTGIAIMTAVYHGVVRTTSSPSRGFSAISLLACLFSVIGFCVVFILVKKKGHPKTHPSP